MNLRYNFLLAELCTHFGNIEQQYLGFLISPNQPIDEDIVNKFKSNMQSFDDMLSVNL